MKQALCMVPMVLLAGCLFPRVNASMDGEVVSVKGSSYENVWHNVETALKKKYWHATARKDSGTIYAGNNGCGFGPSDYIGVYINPTVPQAETYDVKIVVNGGNEKRDQEITTEIKSAIEHQLKIGPVEALLGLSSDRKN